MTQALLTYYENYTPVGDILTLAACIVFIILIRHAYINRTKSFFYLKSAIIMIMASAAFDIIYHISVQYIGKIPVFVNYFARGIYHFALYSVLWLFVLYTKTLLGLDRKEARPYFIFAAIGFLIVGAFEIVGTIAGIGYYIDENGGVHSGFPIYPFAYVYLVAVIFAMVMKHQHRFVRMVILSVVETVAASFIVMGIQRLCNQTSFTVATFMFPVFALLYHVHSNPYDIETGTVSEHAFEDFVELAGSKGENCYFMSMYMHDFEGKGRKYPRQIQQAVRYFSTKFFKSATLFQISGGHMILTVETRKNPGYMERSQWMMDEFLKVYPQHRIDYKIVFIESDPRLAKGNDYIAFLHYMHDNMEQNSFVRTENKEVEAYLTNQYIISELKDICEKKNPDDSRVLVYCQPVYSIKTGKFDTAESLMRLVLPKTGMVFPDIFIPIAEKNGYIGALTKIILSKTCKAVKRLIKSGYYVKRISVNFSVYDLREEDFCSVVEETIRSNDIPFEKIAIELTESQNEADFKLIKERINELKGSGIKFYLDDFGTGYSNFERIMELPFDIVKFDRSLVIASGNDERYHSMVSNLARMFREVHYSVLYEGIEDEADEARCIEMDARYLQGYKYSKPIPIERLTEYFEKTS